jgi:hypothetical protein
MALTLERKRQIGLMFPVISSEKRREYVPVGSTAASDAADVFSRNDRNQLK